MGTSARLRHARRNGPVGRHAPAALLTARQLLNPFTGCCTSSIGSLSTGLGTTNSNLTSLSTSTSTGLATVSSGITSLSTGVSTVQTNVNALGTSTASALGGGAAYNAS